MKRPDSEFSIKTTKRKPSYHRPGTSLSWKKIEFISHYTGMKSIASQGMNITKEQSIVGFQQTS